MSSLDTTVVPAAGAERIPGAAAAVTVSDSVTEGSRRTTSGPSSGSASMRTGFS
jgi:hypothetical protein